jgi:hypothetical protein
MQEPEFRALVDKLKKRFPDLYGSDCNLLAAIATLLSETSGTRPPRETGTAPKEAFSLGDAAALVTLKTGWMRHDSGFAYIASGTFATLKPGDNPKDSALSEMLLLEDGVPLGPPHTIHEEIRTRGEGRYSHWNDALWFSSSDNSDPRSNGRLYQIAFRKGDW